MSKIVQFPGNNRPVDKPGPIKNKRMSIECSHCGNTKKFYGVARTQPMIIIERTEHNPLQYEVTEVGYSQNGLITEDIQSCANCGSWELNINILKEDLK